MIKRIKKAVFRRLGYAPINYKALQLEKVKRKWLSSLSVDFIFDIGASDGGFARKIKDIYPKAEIHSFEALPESYEKLKARCAHLENFHAVHVALSDKPGEIEFYLCDNNTGSSSMLEMTDIHKEAYPHTAKNSVLRVNAIRLDDYAQDLQLEQRKVLMKLDVQGAEKIVLDGSLATLTFVDIIFCEINFVETYKGCVLFSELNKFFEQHNFTLAGMENISQSLVHGEFLQADAYYFKK
jgi:FkbM family methyltransferase